jgi:hypothetical protein
VKKEKKKPLSKKFLTGKLRGVKIYLKKYKGERK